MHNFLIFSLISTVLSSAIIAAIDPSSSYLQLNDDILGLIVFKSDIHDPQSLLQSWNEDDSTPCSWQFIKCDPSTGKVTDITLNNLGFSGKIGRGLVNLQSLKVLSLSSNNFTGTISSNTLPASLQNLNLSNNGFSGIIPDSFLSTMNSLQFLDLSDNSFSGPISNDFFHNCPSLLFLSMAVNNLQGPIPSSLKECTTLNSLNLSMNHFSGNPEFIGGIWSLSRLRLLDLSENELSGEIPVGVSSVYNLKEVRLQENRFSGTIPTDIGLCLHLTSLDLSYNFLTGVLSESIARLTGSLSFFSLSNNMFTGDFPQWISKFGNLQYLDLSNNGFTGILPMTIGDDLKQLSHLGISGNRISGGIPVSLMNSNQLMVLKLRDNLLNGSIPEGVFNLGLNEIDFSGNQLSGQIPPMSSSSKLMESLQRLDLSRNNLSGNIPAEIGLFSKLNYLNLSWNGELKSRIPPELGFFQNLIVLDLRNNAFYGSIPENICDSGSLQVLQLDGNSLTGSIPQEIGNNCSSLSLMTLSHNNLTGSIPKSMGNLTKLKILKLEFNQLAGEIPQELGKLENLLAVNISYNLLVGRLPFGNVFQNLDQSALEGNMGICSPLLKKGPCIMNVPKPLVLDPYAYSSGDHSGHKNRGDRDSFRNSYHRRRFFSVSAIVAISASFLIFVGVLVVTLLNVSARRRLAFVGNALEGSCSGSSTFHSGSPSPATGKLVLLNSKSSGLLPKDNSFINKAAEIGSGTFGSVYKATIGSSGGDEFVAIKKLVPSDVTPYQEEFDRHVRILAKAKHPNLVTLRGYYWTPELQLLVSDFIPNGTLQGALHDRAPSVVTPLLGWRDRFNIMVGVGRGLAHLHHSFCPPIIHYNVKPTNILLDMYLNPKISDFGLARLLYKLDKHVVQCMSGYNAPEMACKSLRVNEKCDVYSFGVTMLEVVTGRRPMEYGEDNVVILTERVKAMLERGNVLECVDETMDEYPVQEVLPVLKLALVCASQIPSSRPSMAEVVQILHVIKTPLPQRREVF